MIRRLAGGGRDLLRGGIEASVATAGAVAGDFVGKRPDDPLAERDPGFIRRTLASYRALMHAYFRPKVRGLEHIPSEGPVLLVGNHSGGTLIADTFVFAYEFYDHFGADRDFHQLAHDLVFAVPGLATLRKYGTVPASHENAERALDRGAALLVYPGGDWETYRPSWRSAEIDFAGRQGFINLALAKDVPVVPVVSIGGQETALFLSRGERVSKLLGLDRLFRLKVVPLQFAPPWGFTVLDLPGRIPLPAQITIQVLPPIDLRAEFGDEPDVEEVYRDIHTEMQLALDELADDRDVPVVGTIGHRERGSEVADELSRSRAD
ncbi:MAG: acyltransferase family protein [Solirubrobacterales bacterium]|nr:acyltransferase family protein [Solirubrobacterales bacterium]